MCSGCIHGYTAKNAGGTCNKCPDDYFISYVRLIGGIVVNLALMWFTIRGALKLSAHAVNEDSVQDQKSHANAVRKSRNSAMLKVMARGGVVAWWSECCQHVGILRSSFEFGGSISV